MLSRIIFVCLIIVNSAALAEEPVPECEIEVAIGLLIHPSNIRLLQHHRTQVQFNPPAQVIVRGEVLVLDDYQQQLVMDYTQRIQSKVPQFIDLTVDGARLAANIVNELAASLHGEDTEGHLRVQSAMEHVMGKMLKKFNHAEEHFYLGPQAVQDVEKILEDHVEKEINEALSSSIGAFFTQLADGKKGADFSMRMQQFSLRMASLRNTVFKELEQQGGDLKKRSDEFCLQLIELDAVETRMHQAIPKLDDYDVFKIRQSAKG